MTTATAAIAMVSTAASASSLAASSAYSSKEFLPTAQCLLFSPFSRKPLVLRASSAAVASAPADTDSASSVPRLKVVYVGKVVPALKEEFKYKNSLEPRPQPVSYLCGVKARQKRRNGRVREQIENFKLDGCDVKIQSQIPVVEAGKTNVPQLSYDIMGWFSQYFEIIHVMLHSNSGLSRKVLPWNLGIWLNEHRNYGGPRQICITIQGVKRPDGRVYP